MKKIAFLCYSVLPYTSSWGSAQRIHHMASSLCDEYEVSVIGSKSTDTPLQTNFTQPYKTIFLDNSLERRLFKTDNGKTIIPSVSKKPTIKEIGFRAMTTLIKKINSLLFNEPTYFQGFLANYWIRKNSENILNYLKVNNITTLIISIPPWNMLTLSFLTSLKKIGCHVIIDYRDPWNCWNNKKGLPFIREGRFAKMVDAIIVTNENHAQKLAEDFKLPRQKIFIIMNGYDAKVWKNIIRPPYVSNDKLIISYIGTISFADKASFRDPRVFMEALSLFEHKDKIIFRVVGCYSEEALAKYKPIIPNFEMIPKVSQEESLVWMTKSDVLVNFHTTTDNSSSYLIAGKIFDYYKSGAKILSINGRASYERKFVEDNGLGYYSPNNVSDILNTLNEMYSDWSKESSNFIDSKEVNAMYSRQFQNSNISQVFDYLKIN